MRVQGYGFSSVCFPPKIDLDTLTEENGAASGFWRDFTCSVPLGRPLKEGKMEKGEKKIASIIWGRAKKAIAKKPKMCYHIAIKRQKRHKMEGWPGKRRCPKLY